MKTSIIDELNLPESVQQAARREAMRMSQPVNVVIAKWVIEKAAAINAAAQQGAATTKANAA
jgi:hypothetical protein